MTRSLAVFVHFDRQDRVADYVVAYVKALRAEVSDLVFVSTAKLSKTEQAKVQPYASQVLVRDNIGYDFMSWQVGLAAAGDLSGYDEVMIANDSCYAPLFALGNFLTRMRALPADFWGVTASHEIAYHVQSYFMGFSRQVVASPVFAAFWQGIKAEADKMDVVRKYEVGLSQQLQAAGFKPAVFYDVAQPIGVQQQVRRDVLVTFARMMICELWRDPVAFVKKALNVKQVIGNRRNIVRRNPSLYGWRQGLALRSPFVKVMLIRDNTYPGMTRAKYLAEISAASGYDTGLIEQHLVD